MKVCNLLLTVAVCLTSATTLFAESRGRSNRMAEERSSIDRDARARESSGRRIVEEGRNFQRNEERLKRDAERNSSLNRVVERYKNAPVRPTVIDGRPAVEFQRKR